MGHVSMGRGSRARHRLLVWLAIVSATVLGTTTTSLAAPTSYLSDGTLDTTFNAGGVGFEYFATPWVKDFVVQPDGKIVAVGNFSSYNGTAVPGVIRLNADGSIDSSFSPGTGPNDGRASGVALQSDGKILITGGFSSFAGNTSQAVARLNANGSWDSTFVSPFGPYHVTDNPNPFGQKIAVLGDGSILIVGDFTKVGVTAAGHVAKLSSSGTFDTVFNGALGTGANATVSGLTVDPLGRIYIFGGFTQVNGSARPGIARLSAGGTLDSFNPTLSGTKTVENVAIQSDGKIIVSGQFTGYIARVNEDGTPDTSFVSGGGFSGGSSASGLALSSDGRIYVGGRFTQYQGAAAPGLIRLLANGTRDTSFNPGSGLSTPYLFPIRVLSSGDILITGNFAAYNGINQGRIARLTSAEAIAARDGSSGSGGDSSDSDEDSAPSPEIVPAQPALAATGFDGTPLLLLPLLALFLGGTFLGLAHRRRIKTGSARR